MPLLPLANGKAGTFGKPMAVGEGKRYILATRRQQGLIPQLKDRFVHLKVVKRLTKFFGQDAFLKVCVVRSGWLPVYGGLRGACCELNRNMK